METDIQIILKEDLNKFLQQIFQLQEERVLYWNEFELQFKEYLLDAPNFDLEKLKLICKGIGNKMNDISSKILSIKSNFSNQEHGIKKINDLIEKLQTNEQMKFQLVILILFLKLANNFKIILIL